MRAEAKRTDGREWEEPRAGLTLRKGGREEGRAEASVEGLQAAARF